MVDNYICWTVFHLESLYRAEFCVKVHGRTLAILDKGRGGEGRGGEGSCMDLETSLNL
jgi:hypothetical protein